MGCGHFAQPGMPAATAGQAAPGTGTGAGSMQGCGWTWHNASGFCSCQHLDEGNVVAPENLEMPATADPLRVWGACYSCLIPTACSMAAWQMAGGGDVFQPVCVTACLVPSPALQPTAPGLACPTTASCHMGQSPNPGGGQEGYRVTALAWES